MFDVYFQTGLKLLRWIGLTLKSVNLVNPNLSEKNLDLSASQDTWEHYCVDNLWMRCTPEQDATRMMWHEMTSK